jgi:hypothetical protein
MNTHSDPIEQLLDRQGEHWRSRFVPPALDGMLAVATAPAHRRSRWVWPLVAAIALLVIPLVTVVAVQGPQRSPTATHAPGFLGRVDWSSAVLQIDGRTVTVAAEVDRTPNYCLDFGVPALHGVVSETARRVTITVQAFRPIHPSPTPSVPPGAVLGCSAVGHRPVQVSVALGQPLGNRTLIDSTTGTRHRVFEASSLPAPSYLPAGYVDQGISWREDISQSQVLHDYIAPGGELRVVRGHGDTTPPDQQMVTTGTVLGHPAQVTRNSYPPIRSCVVWNDPEYSWAICSVEPPGARRAPLGAADLLRIGNSMR